MFRVTPRHRQINGEESSVPSGLSMHIFYVTGGRVEYTRPTSSVCCDCVNVFLQAGVHYESYASILLRSISSV